MCRKTFRTAVVAVSVFFAGLHASAANPAGDLRIEVGTAYNFVVDSNVESPSTYAPRSAYLSATYYNDGTNALTDVWAYIGDYTNNTPGVYPSRTHAGLVGTFSLQHEGGSLGTADASRYLRTLDPGESVTVYWLVSYPNLDEEGNTVTGGIKPDDDLWLQYSIWGTAQDGGAPLEAEVDRTVTMRNEISAAANKIFPNGANKVPQAYKDLLAFYEPSWTNAFADGSPGTFITTEGIWYDLGNVGAGFDNDGDLIPDRNAWLQPVGDPTLFDPSCFRLVQTYALVIVKLNDGTEKIYDIRDQLYFENIPENNRGAVGYVRYDFLALCSGGASQLTPYQEVASGFDNEKFNGDYGAFLGDGLSSPASQVELVKSADAAVTGGGSNISYTVAFTNAGAASVGQPDFLLPLVVQDSIPPGTVYVAGSADSNNTLPSGVTGYTVYYSTNSGALWSSSEPAVASDVTDLQWWLSDTLVSGAQGAVTFDVLVDDPAPPLVHNVAGLSLGNTIPFVEDDATTLVTGTNQISGTVFEDTGVGTGGHYGNGAQDGSEPGISTVTVSLYYDINGNSILDDGDPLFETIESAVDGTYTFSEIPNGGFIVVVDDLDSDVPTGYTMTMPDTIPVVISNADSTGNDFGFAPGLGLTKTGPALLQKGAQAVYSITVTNLTPATVEGPTVVYTNWASLRDETKDSGTGWVSHTNALNDPDAAVATLTIASKGDDMGLTGFGPARDGTATNVQLVVRGYRGAVAKSSDVFTINMWTNGAAAGVQVQSFTADTLPAVNSDLVFDVTSNFSSFAWSTLTNATIVLSGAKSGGAGGSLVNVDAVGLIVSYAGPAAVLDSVPLEDFYDTNVLQFVSATPGVTTSDFAGPSPNTGRLYWENVGPLGPGTGTNLTVTFDVIGPAGNAGTVTTNTASITNATYNTGAAANEASDTAESEVPPTGTIGDMIFWDANTNGTQDYSESGIAGVTVELYLDADTNGVYETFVTNAVTDADGLYLFDQLSAGYYLISVITNSGPLADVTQSADPGGNGEAFASCDNQHELVLGSGQTFTGADFGYVPPGVLGDLLWIDTNDNGVKDAGENGIPYVSVVLYSNGTAVVTNETDADGYYYFSGLSDGTYQITVATNDTDFPSGVAAVYDRDGTPDSTCTDIVISGGSVISIGGSSVTNADLDIDFGYRYAGNNSLSGTIGMDAQPYDGVLNGTNTSGVASNESAYVDVDVYIYLWTDDGDGIVESGEFVSIASTQTDANGDYAFNNLPAGTAGDKYIVAGSAPDDYLKITTTNGSIAGVTVVETVNAEGNTVSAYLTVDVASSVTGMDFAYRSSIRYDYGDLPAGYHTLLPAGARHVIPAATSLYLGSSVDGEDNGQPSATADLDSFDDGVSLQGIWQNGTGGATVQVQVGAGSGYLAGFVDFDQDGDLGSVGELIVSRSVSVTGGLYTLSFDVPAGTLSVTNTTALYSRFRLFSSAPNFPALAYQGTADNGEVEDYRWSFNVISGSVYADDDTDTLFSAGDTAQAGVAIRLYDASSNLVAETVTDLDGDYSFYGLPDGDYRIEMQTPAGSAAILDADGSSNGNSTVEPTLSGASVYTQDFLLDTAATTAGVSGTVYDDDGLGVAGNGAFDSDTPVPCVPVELYRDLNTNGVADANERIGTVATDESGNYSFTGLPNGDYILLMSTPSGAVSVDDSDGSSNGTDLIEASLAGSDINSLDFLIDGLGSLAVVGDRVWFDANDNGLQDAGDTNSIANLPVQLVNTNGVPVASTSTDSNGVYRFENIVPGTYLVRFDLTGVSSSLKIVSADAGDDMLDSDGVSGASGGMVETAYYTLDSGQTNLTVDLGVTYLSATRAEVAEVRGEWRGDSGYAVWETGSEWNTAGFFAYWIDPETGDETPLNMTLLPSAFIDGGSGYELFVPQAEEQGSAIIRLEEMELTGARRDLGTHGIVFAEPPVAAVAKRSVAAALPAAEVSPEPSPVLKVFVRREGLYGVSLQTIADGMGRSLSDIQTLAADESLCVTCQGIAVPVRFDVAGDRILFHGEPTDNWYARDAAYLISEGPGLSMLQRDAAAVSGETVFPAQIRIEEDQYPFDSALNRPDDFYYWNYLIAGHPSLGRRDYPLDLSGYASGDLELTVCLRGWSSTDMDPGHQADFLFNGDCVGTVVFDDQDVVETMLTVPAGTVLDGTNTLTVTGVLQAGHSHSFFVMDWIDASFSREPVPSPATAYVNADDASTLSAAAFTEPLVIALDESGAPTWICDETGGLVSKAWRTEADDARFAVIDAEKVPMLGTSPAADDAWFLSSSNRIDYLIVTSEDLKSAAQELADYRAGQGLRVGVAVFEDICDLLTGGLRTPESIPALLRYARQNWEQAPWMVVLAGNGHYDYLGVINAEVNHIPPLLLDTHDGLFAADGLLADLDGDQLPDLAVGRLPALTAADLMAMIAKIKAYEASFGSATANQLVFAADAADAAGDFAGANISFAALADGAHSVDQIDLDTDAIADARAQLVSRFNGGAGFIHYTGHGGVNNFSSQNLLSASDVSGLGSSDTPPVVVALSCLVGRYEAPGVNGMGEILMRRAGGGAVSVWGPSGLSRNAPAVELGDAFYRAVLQEGSGTLGLAILQARRSLQADLLSGDTYAVYNLLGDPALRIAGNIGGQDGDSNFAQWRWQRFAPEELADKDLSNGQNIFFEYVCGDEGSPRLNLRNSRLSWEENAIHSDLDYRVLVSTNLVDWAPAGSDLKILSEQPSADHVMKKITAELNVPASSLFIKLEVIPK